MTTLRELLVTVKKTIDKNPEFLDLPVYAVDTSSGVIYEEISIGDNVLSEYDIDMGCFDSEDLGKQYVAIYL